MSQDLEAPTSLILNIGTRCDMDRDALDSLTRQLRSELFDLKVESVELIREGVPLRRDQSRGCGYLGRVGFGSAA